MGDREVRIRFTGDSKVLKGSAGEVRKVFQQLTEDQDDARGAGEKLAAAQKTVADKMRAEMKAITETADVLADSLGPEMVAAMEASGRSVEDEVQRLQQLGLKMEDIVRDSELIANGMREMDDAARMGTGAVGDGLKKVESGFDKAGKASSSFAGNVVGDLASSATGFGPMSEGIAQLTEGLLEGEAGFKSLIGAAGGMAAVAVVMNEFAKQKREAAEVDAFNKAQVDSYRKSLAAGESELEAIVNQLREAGKLETKLAGWLGDAFGGDATQAMADIGVSVDMFAEAVAKGQPGIDALKATLTAIGADGDDAATVLLAAQQQMENMAKAKAADEAARKVGLVGDSMSTAEREAARLAASLDRTNAAWERFTGALDAEDTFNNVMLGFDDLAAEIARLNEEYAAGGMSAEDYARRVELATNGQKRAVADYIAEVAKLPPEQATEIMTLIDAGSFEEVERRLADMERVRQAKVNISKVDIDDRRSGPYGTARAAGGPTSPDTGYQVAESGAEFYTDGRGNTYMVDRSGGGRVSPAQRGSAGGSRSSSRPNVSILIDARGMDPDQLVRTLKEHLRRNGGEL